MIRRIVPLALLALLLLASTFLFCYYRDNFSTHYPVKVLTAAALRAGEIPYWNFYAGGGQPLAGNPNTLTFYPDTLLYLFLPQHVAFNFHFFGHLFLGWFTMRGMLRQLRFLEATCAAGATIYLASGVVVSSLAFYNLVTAVALVPLALLLVERMCDDPAPRNALLLGVTFGLLALAGEPVTVLAVAAASIVIAIPRLKLPVLFAAFTSLVIAVAVASPLLVAYGEIAAEVERGGQPFSTRTVLASSLRPEKIAELFLGPFLGLPTDLGPGGYQDNPALNIWPPLYGSIFLGAILFPALFAAGRIASRYRLLLVAFLFIGLGRFNPIVAAIVEASPGLRIVRYPEKLALGITIFAIVLLATLLESGLAPRRLKVASAFGLLISAAGLVAALMMGLATPVGARLSAGSILAIATLLFAWHQLSRPGGVDATALPAGESQPAEPRAPLAMSSSSLRLVAITLVPLLYWASRVATIDFFHFYRQTPQLVEKERRVWRPQNESRFQPAEPKARHEFRMKAAAGDPLFGAAFGARFYGDRSPDGMYSFLSRIVQERIASVPEPQRLHYLQIGACESIVTRRQLAHEGIRPTGKASISGIDIFRYELIGTQPRVAVVRSLHGVRSIQEAVGLIENDAHRINDPAVVPMSKAGLSISPAKVKRVERRGQTIEMEILSEGTSLLVVNESYFTAWVARLGNKELSTFPVNIDRLGVLVPPGSSLVQLRFGRRRTLVGVCVLLSSLLLCMAAFSLLTRQSRKATATPAR